MIRTFREFVTAHNWAYAVPAGLVSAAYVFYNSPGGGTFYFGIVFWAGLLGGLLTLAESSGTWRIGFRTGSIGALPALQPVVSVAGTLPGFDLPAITTTLHGVLLIVFGAISVLLVGALGAIGAKAGGWLSRKIEPGTNPIDPSV
ncbi:DUF5518 domain-containing protein [Natronomonas marina]|jgi:hypothetical protein|uniref:DUF5518 domain-containing protein n=1 Tax=Natronomonas marina TaxID=2961939 RepID=UPI0020CA16F1|nr:DUF5518 domain-containing protein [Natronomonas marina]